MKTKERTEYSETIATQVLGSHEFNESRVSGFQIYRTKRPKENIGWLMTAFFLFFGLLFGVTRFTVIGQFLDDVFFDLPWGWFKFPIYLALFFFVISFYLNYHFKFKAKFVLMSCSFLLLTAWLTSLALLTYIYDRQIAPYDIPINQLWDKEVFGKSFKIYWFNWKDFSVFAPNYAKESKLDFLFKNDGYVSLYAGGGAFGYLLAAFSYYLSLPGAYIFYALWFLGGNSWILTGDALFLLKPKHRRYGRALRLLPLSKKDKPAGETSPLISTKPRNSLLLTQQESDPYLSTELLTLQHFDDDFSLENQAFMTTEFSDNDYSLDEETLNSETDELNSALGVPPSSLPKLSAQSTIKKTKFASSILQTNLDQKVAPRFQSRREPIANQTAIKTNKINNDIPLAKLQQKRSNSVSKSPQTHQTQSEIYNQLDPQEARRLFEKETSVTPFGKMNKNSLFPEIRYPNYQLPTLALLDVEINQILNRQYNQNHANQILNHLNYWLINQNFSARCQLVHIGEAVTRYQFECESHLNPLSLINQEASLKSIAKTNAWRWVPDKANSNTLIFEIPNQNPLKVQLKSVLQGIPHNKQNYNLLFGLGKRLSGELLTANLENMPHILIAGQPKSGKTMLLNNLLASLLLRNKPDEVKLVIIDSPLPALINFSHLPHLLTPFISNGHHIYPVLEKLSKVISQRFQLFNLLKINNIESYNQKVSPQEKLPYLVVVINELSDLKNNPDWSLINTKLRELTEQGQNFGVHFVIATSQPEANLKDEALLRNCPTRLAFKLPNHQASTAILGQSGAEQLTSPGDLLFVYPGATQLIRAQSVLLSQDELKRLLTFIYQQVEINDVPLD